MRSTVHSLATLLLGLAFSTAIGCGGDGGEITTPTGSVEVRTTTSGEPLGDYSFTVDGGSPSPIGSNATITLSDLPAGDHVIELSGLPAGCTVAEENPRTITVTAGASTTVTFTVTCPPANGAIQVTTATTGPAPAGSELLVDATSQGAIGPSAVHTLPEVLPGTHSVGLAGIPANCQVTGQNPLSVVVEPGATAAVSFAVTCTEPPAETGTLTITTTTTGSDPDGFRIVIDGGAPQPIALTGTLTVPDLAAGDHTVRLGGLASNCSVSGPNPRSVNVPAGASVTVAFVIECATTLEWTRMQSGTTYSLIDVWGSGAADVFVVGERGGGFHGGIFHYNGQSWSQTYSEDGPIPESVWGTGPTNVFAVGSDPLATFGNDGIILHFDGSTWTRMTGPGVGNDDRQVSFHGVWGSSPTDVYAVGIVFDQLSHALIARFDGSQWSSVPLPVTNDRILEDVHGASGGDIYAVGFIDISGSLRRGMLTPSLRSRTRQGSLGLILHFNGFSWNEFSPPEADVFFNGVWSNASNDVFAVGGRGSSGAIYHFDGNTWSPMSLPATGELFEVWGAAANDVYAAGAGVILHYDGAAWSVVQSVPERLTGVWGSSASDVFAVGSNGSIYHGPPAPVTVRR